MLKPAFGLALKHEATNAKALAKSYGPCSGVRSNHVISQSGEFVGVDGSSRSISTAEDRELLIALRQDADLIVVDAATARREKYRAPSSGAKLAIFSKTGAFDNIPAVSDSPEDTFLFFPSLGASIEGSTSIVIRDLDLPFEGFNQWTKLQGFKSVLLEAGPTLTATAFAARVIKHSAITITPNQVPLEQLAGVHPFDKKARLTSVAYSTGATLTYWSH